MAPTPCERRFEATVIRGTALILAAIGSVSPVAENLTAVLYGRFFGIDRFSDPNITELAACVRDAAALWALFNDTLPEMDAVLYRNEDATAEAMREAIRVLNDACDEDVVVLTFATHGAPDYSIVAYDTSFLSWAKTTVPMQQLVDAFRASRAKFILCALDICHSGEAPARVVQGAPRSRTIFDLTSIAGEGRVMIAAARSSQSAYEHPQQRHGLLTAALIAELTSPGEGALSVPVLIDSVVNRVRVEAEGLGYDQNAVATTYTDSGFFLPRFGFGETYAREFPDFGGVRVANVEDLAAFALPNEVVTAWSARFDNHLHQLQLDAVNIHRVLDGASLLVVAPTSSGKTFIGEMAAARAIVDGRKAVFLLPYRALVSEKYEDFSAFYGHALGLRVIRCSGDYSDQIGEFVQGRYDIAMLTYEMFLVLSVANPALLNLIGLVVLDEAQFIADTTRGITVELILTNLRLARGRGISPQLLLLSAVLSQVETFAEWLGFTRLVSSERPVPLEVGVLDRSGVFEYLAADGTRKTDRLLQPFKIRQRKSKPGSQDVIVPLVQSLMRREDRHEDVLIFRAQRGKTWGTALYLAAELGLPPADDAIAALPVTDPSSASPLLREALRGGTAFHNRDLNAQERAVVENAFRKADGGIRVVAATSTLAAGINTPASTVIIAETARAEPGNPPMTVGEVRNMAGRAGRFGYRESGRAIILANNPFERSQLFARYVISPPESVRSSFADEHLDTWLIRLLRQVAAGIHADDVPALLMNTYGAYLRSRANPGFAPALGTEITRLLADMRSSSLLSEDADRMKLTILGSACALSSLRLRSCIAVIATARPYAGAGTLSVEHLLVLTQCLPELDATYVPLRKAVAESRWVNEASARFGRQLTNDMAQNAVDQAAYWRRLKRTLLCLAWCDGMPIAAIEQRFSVVPFFEVRAGDVRSCADSARYHLRSVYEILSAAFPANVPPAEDVDVFLARLEFGVPAAGLPFVALMPAIGREDVMALVRSGLADMDAIRTKTREELSALVGAQVQQRISNALAAAT